jgi:hypothetical protein
VASWYRVLKSTGVTLSQRFAVDEVPTDATGDVTVTVKRLDGAAVASGTAVHPGEPGLYTFALPGQALVDMLTVDWAGTLGGNPVSVRDVAEVVGGFLFDLAKARARFNWKPGRYTPQVLAEMRTVVEQECEDICGWAFVPRFDREVLTGNGCSGLATTRLMLRTLRSATVDGVALTAPELADVKVGAAGVLNRRYGYWPHGAEIIAEYEHGHDVPPVGISTQAAYRLRTILDQPDSIVDERALSYSVADGGTYRLSTPAADRTGVPTIDAVYERYSYTGGGAGG